MERKASVGGVYVSNFIILVIIMYVCKCIYIEAKIVPGTADKKSQFIPVYRDKA